MKINETNGQYSRIDKATTITGNIVSDTDLRIDGTMDGNVNIKGKIIIGKDALVKGKINCYNADIEGSFKGELIVIEGLTLKSTSKIEGEVIVGKLIVDAGSIFNATCSMNNDIEGVKSLTKKNEKTA
jgi:cytoskeletal protein CcmA (bactofilin family)